MVKKRITGMLCIAVLALGLTGCGKESAGSPEESVQVSEKIKLTGMVWGGTESHEEITKLLFEDNPALAEKYEVEWIIGGQGDGEVAEKIRLALSANEPIADFVQINYTQLAEFAQAGILADTSASITKYQDVLAEGAITLSQYNGQHVAFPFELKPRVWYYRADIFEEAGVDVNTVKTVDDLIAAGKKIQAVDPGAYIWNLGADAPAYSFFMTLSGNGARFSDEDGNYCINTDPGVRTMLEEYKKLVDSGVVLAVSDWTTDWENALNDGTLVSQLGAGWLAQNAFLPTYASGQEGKWQATTWPGLAGADAGSDAGGSVFAIPAFSSNPKAAAEFLEELTLSESGSKAIYDVIAAIPVNKKTLAHEDVQKPNPFFGESLLAAQTKALEQFAVFNYSSKAESEITIVLEYFIKAVGGELSIDDALNQAQSDLETMIGNAKN